ncbi:MAG: methionine--tRNA ligase, partial [Syntrophomonadaceae bacterium]|nr:methionine--tRNA ligase [Syntrophomonadaceae bacterium]
MKVFIGGAWPYANGSLHIGHVAALLPGDILARYFRLKGIPVCYVSGSDCHGTPIQLRAQKEGISPQAIVDNYHKEFETCFKELGFSYDLYSRTDDSYHKEFVSGFFHRLLDSGYIYRKTVEQAFCTVCHQFLPDRFVIGICPSCGSTAKGDQCDSCGSLLDPGLLYERKCGICQASPIFRPSEHFFLALSHLEAFIQNYVSTSRGWRTNALRLSQRYLNEGLQDRAITRDLDWGIDIPLDGYYGKKIYVWVEAVLGYLSASRKWALNNNENWIDFWSGQSVHYYVHGKDNIPFHTIILPALLQAHGGLHLPDRIISSEYCTLEGRKISTSENWAVWIPDLLKRYHPDSIRYFFIMNGPEKRDSNFSWQEFILRHNSELLGAFGNFVHRSLVFLQKYYSNRVPQGQCD